MLNHNDVEKTKELIHSISDINQLRVVYHTFGSPLTGKLKNPFGQYSRLEFLTAPHFFAYATEFIDMVPDSIFQLTSYRSCSTRYGTNMVIGSFVYKATFIKSHGNLEKYLQDESPINIERCQCDTASDPTDPIISPQDSFDAFSDHSVLGLAGVLDDSEFIQSDHRATDEDDLSALTSLPFALPEFVAVECRGSVALTFDVSGKVVLLEFFNQFN